MSETRQDLTELEPFEIVKSSEETDDEYVRFEYTLHPSSDTATSDYDLPHKRTIVDADDPHLHQVEEYWKVLAGEFCVVIDGEERLLTEGDDITLPRGVPHNHYNPSDKPTRVQWEFRPPLGVDEGMETLYTLAQAGKTNEDGLPNRLHTAVILDEYPGLFYSPNLPVSLQKILVSLLAAVGRLAGYKTRYRRDEIDQLR